MKKLFVILLLSIFAASGGFFQSNILGLPVFKET
jgi:hypothetical protein